MSLSSVLNADWRDNLRADLSDIIKTAPSQYGPALERIDRLFDEGETSDRQTAEAIRALAEPAFLSWHERVQLFAAELIEGADEEQADDDDGLSNDGCPIRTPDKTEDGKAHIYMCGDGFNWVRLRDYNRLLAQLRELQRGSGGSV